MSVNAQQQQYRCMSLHHGSLVWSPDEGVRRCCIFLFKSTRLSSVFVCSLIFWTYMAFLVYTVVCVVVGGAVQGLEGSCVEGSRGIPCVGVPCCGWCWLWLTSLLFML